MHNRLVHGTSKRVMELWVMSLGIWLLSWPSSNIANLKQLDVDASLYPDRKSYKVGGIIRDIEVRVVAAAAWPHL